MISGNDECVYDYRLKLTDKFGRSTSSHDGCKDIAVNITICTTNQKSYSCWKGVEKVPSKHPHGLSWHPPWSSSIHSAPGTPHIFSVFPFQVGEVSDFITTCYLCQTHNVPQPALLSKTFLQPAPATVTDPHQRVATVPDQSHHYWFLSWTFLCRTGNVTCRV